MSNEKNAAWIVIRGGLGRRIAEYASKKHPEMEISYHKSAYTTLASNWEKLRDCFLRDGEIKNTHILVARPITGPLMYHDYVLQLAILKQSAIPGPDHDRNVKALEEAINSYERQMYHVDINPKGIEPFSLGSFARRKETSLGGAIRPKTLFTTTPSGHDNDDIWRNWFTEEFYDGFVESPPNWLSQLPENTLEDTHHRSLEDQQRIMCSWRLPGKYVAIARLNQQKYSDEMAQHLRSLFPETAVTERTLQSLGQLQGVVFEGSTTVKINLEADPFATPHSPNNTNPHHKKETSMSNHINVVALANLVKTKPSDDLDGFLAPGVGINDELKEAIEQAEKDERTKVVKEAAQSIRNLHTVTNTVTEKVVNELRAIRQREKDLKAQLEEISRAKAYAVETTNYVPLMRLVVPAQASVIPLSLGVDGLVHTVPADWVAPSDRKDPDQKANLVDNNGGTVVINGDTKGPDSPGAAS